LNGLVSGAKSHKEASVKHRRSLTGATHKNFLSVRRRASRNARRKLAFQLLLLYVGMMSKVMFEQWITRELS
jgi:hypothetical protein